MHFPLLWRSCINNVLFFLLSVCDSCATSSYHTLLYFAYKNFNFSSLFTDLQHPSHADFLYDKPKVVMCHIWQKSSSDIKLLCQKCFPEWFELRWFSFFHFLTFHFLLTSAVNYLLSK